ncbi:unnamed protein product [Aphis gossypii]|uniref:Uncharacterized protein n=1 Tax=Aphis gossypii TaxID=80765 RepID=A0A9P0J9A5_APHGO|nr:unnamed protein product [Aphis gossypii]
MSPTRAVWCVPSAAVQLSRVLCVTQWSFARGNCASRRVSMNFLRRRTRVKRRARPSDRKTTCYRSRSSACRRCAQQTIYTNMIMVIIVSYHHLFGAQSAFQGFSVQDVTRVPFRYRRHSRVRSVRRWSPPVFPPSCLVTIFKRFAFVRFFSPPRYLYFFFPLPHAYCNPLAILSVLRRLFYMFFSRSR